mgnify:CR=1 FL=1
MLKFKAIKDKALQQEYMKAGLLWYDCTPWAIKYVRPYWVPRYSFPVAYPQLCDPDRVYPVRNYKMLILVEE